MLMIIVYYFYKKKINVFIYALPTLKHIYFY